MQEARCWNTQTEVVLEEGGFLAHTWATKFTGMRTWITVKEEKDAKISCTSWKIVSISDLPSFQDHHTDSNSWESVSMIILSRAPWGIKRATSRASTSVIRANANEFKCRANACTNEPSFLRPTTQNWGEFVALSFCPGDTVWNPSFAGKKFGMGVVHLCPQCAPCVSRQHPMSRL